MCRPVMDLIMPCHAAWGHADDSGVRQRNEVKVRRARQLGKRWERMVQQT